MSQERIPVVNLTDYNFTDPERRVGFIDALGQGLERFGFVGVTGHGIEPSLLERAYAAATEVFALPADVKARYETPENGRQRGYTSFGVEHAKGVPVPDLKEFWHVGRFLGDDHPLHRRGDVPPNLFPAEVPAFAEYTSELFDEFEHFALRLLDAVAEYLGQQPEYFRDMVADGNSVLRVIHYPDLGENTLVPGAVRASSHEDINLLTVLPASTQPGLQILTREGEWLPVDVPPGVMICDTGDMMQLLTAGRLPATTHRVVNPPGGGDGGRLSMPFFLHPHPDHLITPIRPDFAEPVLTRDFLKRRLEEIGVG